MDIVVSFPGGKRVDAQAGGFHIATDQPVEDGGQGAPRRRSRCFSRRWPPVPGCT